MNEGLQALLFILGFFAIIGLLWIIVWQLVEEKSITRRFFSMIYNKFKKVKKRNTLYQCQSRNCNRLFRLYQIDLLLKKDRHYTCPHCESVVSTGYYEKRIDKKVEKPDKWMDSHSDCFKVSLKQYFMIQSTAKKVKQLREEEEAIKRFEDYNKLSTDMSWIEKIQKVSN